jgi:hypothetical protein
VSLSSKLLTEGCSLVLSFCQSNASAFESSPPSHSGNPLAGGLVTQNQYASAYSSRLVMPSRCRVAQPVVLRTRSHVAQALLLERRRLPVRREPEQGTRWPRLELVADAC